MQHLIVFADYACPYCYLAETELERIRGAGLIAVEPAPFELWSPGTALPSRDVFRMRSDWERSILPTAQELGVRLREPEIVTRTRKAHEAVAYARAHGAAPAMHRAIYEAYWHEGRDIGRIDVLMELAVAVGLEGTALKVALDIDQWTAQVERHEARAAELGISGVPAYVLLEDGAVTGLRAGLQRFDELRNWITGNHDI